MRSSFTLTGHDDYSPAIADLICERLMEGASLRQIYQDRNMPARSIAITHLVGLRISPTILPSRNSRAAESPPFRQIRRWREHLLLSWRRSMSDKLPPAAAATDWLHSQKNSTRCYIIQRDARESVIYRDHLPGMDPETGRECRLVTIGLVER